MSDIKLAFMASLGYGRMTPEDVVRSIKSIGYDGVEWTLAHFNPRTKSPAELERLVEITEEGGLEISEAVVQQDVVCLDDAARADRIKLALECIDAAGEIGVRTLNFFTGPAPWDPTAPVIGRDIEMGTAWQQIIDAFDQFVPAAAQADVHLAVEGVWGHFCHDYFTTYPLIHHYRQDCLGVNFDPSHDVLYTHTDIGWIVRQWGPAIKHCHLKDAVGVPAGGKFLFPFLGEGHVDWTAFFTALDAIGFKGFCSVEFESFGYLDKIMDGDVEAAARMSFEQIQKLRPQG
ncbi:MAG: sugar phosphate isomerase/epimerase [Phycisphaerae bacterium]|nr:sugar phosphate isomerase/epimerase [Phycisphaerae bacterium]